MLGQRSRMRVSARPRHEGPPAGELLPSDAGPRRMRNDGADHGTPSVVRRRGRCRRARVRVAVTRLCRASARRAPAGSAGAVRRPAGSGAFGRERDLRSSNSCHASEDCPPGSRRAEKGCCHCDVRRSRCPRNGFAQCIAPVEPRGTVPPPVGLGRSGGHAAIFRGRPRGRLRAITTPWSKISPPQTPHGSPRSSAAARHCWRIGQSTHSALACSSSSGRSAKNRSGSPVWQGRLSMMVGSGSVEQLHHGCLFSVRGMGGEPKPGLARHRARSLGTDR